MKKLNRKGFTLIELLAVIVILAIILVIAVPSVLNIQSDAKRGTAADEAILALRGYEMCISAEETSSSCNTPAGLADYYDNADGLITMTIGTTDTNKITAFKYSTNAGYCVEYTAEEGGEGVSSTDLRALIREANKDNAGGVVITDDPCTNS